MNYMQKKIFDAPSTPSKESREILFQSIANQDVDDKITPEFFIAHYMHFVAMTIADGNPSKDTLDTYRKHIDHFLTWCLEKARVSPFKLKENHLEFYRNRLFLLMVWPSTWPNNNPSQDWGLLPTLCSRRRRGRGASSLM